MSSDGYLNNGKMIYLTAIKYFRTMPLGSGGAVHDTLYENKSLLTDTIMVPGKLSAILFTSVRPLVNAHVAM